MPRGILPKQIEIMTELDYAEKWFQLQDIPSIVNNGSIYVPFGAFEFKLSSDDVKYRAELFLESELQKVKVNWGWV